MENDLTTEQIEEELAELIETSADKIDRQESEIVVCDDDDDRQESEMVKNKGKKDPKIKEDFVPLLKADFDKLNRREQFEYKIRLAKFKTGELKKEYEDYKTSQNKAARSAETRKLIILGRFLDTQFKCPNRKVQYLVVQDHLDRYLTDDRDRLLLGFLPLPKSEAELVD